MSWTAFLLTISDSVAAGVREDASGEVAAEALQKLGFEISGKAVVADEIEQIRAALQAEIERGVDLIITSGGTGVGPRDRTPEATAPLLERQLPGLAEAVRLLAFRETPTALLTRGLAGMAKETLIWNLPGNPRAVRQAFEWAGEVLRHAIEIAHGHTQHTDENHAKEV